MTTKPHNNRVINSLRNHWAGAVTGISLAVGSTATAVSTAIAAAPSDNVGAVATVAGAATFIVGTLTGWSVGDTIDQKVNGIKLPETELQVINQYFKEKLGKTDAGRFGLRTCWVENRYLEGDLSFAVQRVGSEKDVTKYARSILTRAGFSKEARADVNLLGGGKPLIPSRPGVISPFQFSLPSEDKFPEDLIERLIDFREGGLGLGYLGHRDDVHPIIKHYESQEPCC
tara:strand:+ start:74 stop:760 length:687 start_codon:yes stop_codon:yes gene_type:complete